MKKLTIESVTISYFYQAITNAWGDKYDKELKIENIEGLFNECGFYSKTLSILARGLDPYDESIDKNDIEIKLTELYQTDLYQAGMQRYKEGNKLGKLEEIYAESNDGWVDYLEDKTIINVDGEFYQVLISNLSTKDNIVETDRRGL